MFAYAANARRLFNCALPATDTLPRQDLPGLSHLHLSSARQLNATIRLLVPAACIQGSETPDATLLNLASPVDSMVLTLVELQLFHLHRVKAITQQMRVHTRQRAQQQQQEQPQEQGPAASSDRQDGSGGCFDDELIRFLE